MGRRYLVITSDPAGNQEVMVHACTPDGLRARRVYDEVLKNIRANRKKTTDGIRDSVSEIPMVERLVEMITVPDGLESVDGQLLYWDNGYKPRDASVRRVASNNALPDDESR